MAGRITKTNIVRDNEWEEWVVQAWVNGKRRPSADYHTDDLQDAQDTQKAMEEGR